MSIPQTPGQVASSSTAPMSEVESTLHRINQHPGVLGILISQSEGKSTRCLASSEDSPLVTHKEDYAQYCTSLAAQARSAVRDLDPVVRFFFLPFFFNCDSFGRVLTLPQDDLKFFRVRTKKIEIMIAPGLLPITRLVTLPLPIVLMIAVFSFCFRNILLEKDYTIICVQDPSVKP
jgi:hypothetical protein